MRDFNHNVWPLSDAKGGRRLEAVSEVEKKGGRSALIQLVQFKGEPAPCYPESGFPWFAWSPCCLGGVQQGLGGRLLGTGERPPAP